MPWYRKKPVEVEARWLSHSGVAQQEIIGWIRSNGGSASAHPEGLTIDTLEGEMTASFGDYVIRGTMGEFYPCKPEIFAATYEKARD